MQRFLLGFCGGALILALPWAGGDGLPGWCAVGAGAGLGGLAVVRVAGGRPGSGVGGWAGVLGVLVGLLWSGAAHQQALDARLSDPPGGDARTVSVRVVGRPVVLAGPPGQPPVARFQARVMKPAGSLDTGNRLRLVWYAPPDIEPEDEFRLQVTVKGPWGYANPGGFDYERWLLGAGVQGTGYVKSGVRTTRPPAGALRRARRYLSDTLGASGLPTRGILTALLTGSSTGVTQNHWRVFRATGTVHLMVISGLHVSLAAGLGFMVGRWLGVIFPPLLLWVSGRALGCVLAVVSGGFYVALAGAGLPAVRALIMTVAVLGPLAVGRTGRSGGAFLLALALILLLHPLAVHQQGFWLSFGAVGILLLTLAHRPRRQNRVKVLLRAQVALSAGMLPVVALATGVVPWTGMAANLLAVPVVSLAVVPALLLGGVLAPLWPGASWLLFRVADGALGLVLSWLGWLADAPELRAGIPITVAAVAQAAMLWALLGPPRRHLAALLPCGLLLLWVPGNGLAPGEYRVTALDVGQGTAVIVDTRNHRLLYDTGPGFPGGFETGSAVVAPSLAETGRAVLNAMILSHDDTDHVGGADYLLESLPVGRVFSTDGAGRGVACHGQRWRWDGVDFSVLDVVRPPGAADNDRSCILTVDDGRQRTLIAGDISARVEPALLRALAGKVTLMFAPHHGSATSSNRALVRVLEPRMVFVSAGFHNRFGHPHPQVVSRYRDVGARMLQTGRHGALMWYSREPGRVQRWRIDRAPYWRSQEVSGSASRR